MSGVIPWIADVLILGALVMLSIAVFGVFRMPDIYTRLHAASKTAVVGIVPLLVAITLTGNPSFIAKAVLIGAFILLTTPVAAHSIARAAFTDEQAEVVAGVVVESAHSSPDPDDVRRRQSNAEKV